MYVFSKTESGFIVWDIVMHFRREKLVPNQIGFNRHGFFKWLLLYRQSIEVIKDFPTTKEYNSNTN